MHTPSHAYHPATALSAYIPCSHSPFYHILCLRKSSSFPSPTTVPAGTLRLTLSVPKLQRLPVLLDSATQSSCWTKFRVCVGCQQRGCSRILTLLLTHREQVEFKQKYCSGMTVHVLPLNRTHWRRTAKTDKAKTVFTGMMKHT